MKIVSCFAFLLLGLVPRLAASADEKPKIEVVTTDVLRTKPQARHRVEPAYPEELLKRGISGKARIEFVITDKGEVTEIKVVEASHPAFGVAAREAVAHSKFSPGVSKDGKPVSVRIQVPFTFNPPTK